MFIFRLVIPQKIKKSIITGIKTSGVVCVLCAIMQLINNGCNMKTEKLNTFTIAHYILLFFVVVLCIGIVAWTLTHGASDGNESPDFRHDSTIL